MAGYETEKVRCREVQVGDWISPANTRGCNFLVHAIEDDAKIAGFLKARRLHLGNESAVTVISNYGPAKPMRRRVR